MLIVLFSTGSEHPTYIIAIVGAMIWIFMQENPFSRKNIVLLILLVLVTGLGPTDVFPKYIRHEFINKYVMKAWPCIVVWLMITYELLVKNFEHLTLPKSDNSKVDSIKQTNAIQIS